MSMMTKRRACAAVVAGALLCAAPAGAQLTRSQNQQQQQLQNLSPPRPGKADRPPALWMIIMAVLLGGAVAGVAFIPSKRGHQD